MRFEDLRPFALLMGVTLGLTGCANVTGIQPQASLRDATSLGLATAERLPVEMDAQWWREFGDPQLKQLVEQARAAEGKYAHRRGHWRRSADPLATSH